MSMTRPFASRMRWRRWRAAAVFTLSL
jgi:hypothetical protein